MSGPGPRPPPPCSKNHEEGTHSLISPLKCYRMRRQFSGTYSVEPKSMIVRTKNHSVRQSYVEIGLNGLPYNGMNAISTLIFRQASDNYQANIEVPGLPLCSWEGKVVLSCSAQLQLDRAGGRGRGGAWGRKTAGRGSLEKTLRHWHCRMPKPERTQRTLFQMPSLKMQTLRPRGDSDCPEATQQVWGSRVEIQASRCPDPPLHPLLLKLLRASITSARVSFLTLQTLKAEIGSEQSGGQLVRAAKPQTGECGARTRYKGHWKGHSWNAHSTFGCKSVARAPFLLFASNIAHHLPLPSAPTSVAVNMPGNPSGHRS